MTTTTTDAKTTPSVAPVQRHPAFDLLARYQAILGAAWTHRAELAGPKRLADEAAFLPAALSLQDTPVHPAPRRFAFGIIALFTIALVWSIVGKVDIVAVAPGRIIVSERTKLIQPLEASVVRRVLSKTATPCRPGRCWWSWTPPSPAPTKPVCKSNSMPASLKWCAQQRCYSNWPNLR